MNGVCIVLVALVAATSAASLGGGLGGLNDQLRQFLENLKKNMDKPQLGLPALDPFVLSHLDLNIDQTIATLNGALDNFKMNKLSTFVINDVSLNIFALTVGFNISLAELDFSGDYNVDGTLGDGLLPVYGKGPFQVSAGDIMVAGAIKLGSNNSYIYIKQFNLTYHLGFVNTNISGLLGGGDLSDVVNHFLSDFIPSVATKYEKQISTLVSDGIVTVANKMLDGVTLKDILDLISGKTTTPKPTTTPSPTSAAPSSAVY